MKLNENDIFITTTDTVLGIGGKVNDVVKKKIYQIKKRNPNKKLVIVIASVEQLKQIEKLNEKHYQYIEKYWPGNTTLIINGNAYRIPNNERLLKFIKKEGPFYLSSANISNEDIIESIDEAKKVFPNLLYFDFGKGTNIPSQIIDVESGEKIR